MNDTMLLVSSSVAIAGVVLNVILIVKFWMLCNDVKRRRKINVDKECNLDELIYLSKTGDATFAMKLQKAIYIDLKRCFKSSSSDDLIDYDYNAQYKLWTKACEHYGWEFPALFKECDSHEKFMAFLSKFHDISVGESRE